MRSGGYLFKASRRGTRCSLAAARSTGSLFAGRVSKASSWISRASDAGAIRPIVCAPSGSRSLAAGACLRRTASTWSTSLPSAEKTTVLPATASAGVDWPRAVATLRSQRTNSPLASLPLVLRTGSLPPMAASNRLPYTASSPACALRVATNTGVCRREVPYQHAAAGPCKCPASGTTGSDVLLPRRLSTGCSAVQSTGTLKQALG